MDLGCPLNLGSLLDLGYPLNLGSPLDLGCLLDLGCPWVRPLPSDLCLRSHRGYRWRRSCRLGRWVPWDRLRRWGLSHRWVL